MKEHQSETLKPTGESSSSIDSDNDYTEIKVERDLEVSMDVDEQDFDPLNTEPNDEPTVSDEYGCGACGVRIEGVSYACVQCENHDVCDACCLLGEHGHHYLLRVPLARPRMETHAVIQCVRRVVQQNLKLQVFEQGDKLKTEVKMEPHDGDHTWPLEWDDETAKEAYSVGAEDSLDEVAERSTWLPAPRQRKQKGETSMAPKSKGSRRKYEVAYKQFEQWKTGTEFQSLSEEVFLAYFSHLSKTMVPTTLWTNYFMVKSMVLQKHNVDMGTYHNLRRMLEKKSDGYTCKTSEVLTDQHLETFINEAPDSTYLDAKVILIFGIYGACRSNELTNIKVTDIETVNHVMMVTLHDTEKRTNRTFVVPDSALAVVRKYQALRPADAETDRFFLNYKNGKCTKQVIGRHKLAKVPSIIATYLNLPNPEKFTGHCFRQSAAALMAKTSNVSEKVDDKEEWKDSDSCGREQPTPEWDDQTDTIPPCETIVSAESDEAEDHHDEVAEEERLLKSLLSHESAQKKANSMTKSSKPLKSMVRYNHAYKKFERWKSCKNLKSMSERVFLAYFIHLSRTVIPSTLWFTYSMLRRIVWQKHNLDIGNYHSLKRMLKKKSDGCTPTSKKSKVLTEKDVEKFINEAPDSTYLDAKVILVFGFYGACRSTELKNVKVNDLETHDDLMIITVNDTVTNKDRTFVIRDTALAVVQKYQALRPADAETDRFFLDYTNGKCTQQEIGRHKLAKVPSIIATYLSLPNPEKFTGLCFRQSAATLFAKTSNVSGKLDAGEESKDGDSYGREDGQTAKKTTASAESDEAEDDFDEVAEEESLLKSLLSHRSSQMETHSPTNFSIPIKSKERYMTTYEKFAQWKLDSNLKSLSESVFMDYFSELSKKMMPTSLWGIYSMLKCTVWQNHNLNIGNYHHLKRMLKIKMAGHIKPKQPRALTEQDVEKFVNEAPDSKYLAAKVILIFGIYGACRCGEMTNITVNDIETHNDVMMVTLRDDQTTEKRTFVIRGTALAVVKKYQALRPALATTDRFFLRYERGKCTKSSVVGRHTIAAVPKMVATYLKLPNPEEFKGYCFRRTSATLFAKPGPTLTTHGGGLITDHTRNSTIFQPTTSQEASTSAEQHHEAGRPWQSKMEPGVVLGGIGRVVDSVPLQQTDQPKTIEIKLEPLYGDASWGDQPSLGQTAHEATASAESDEAGGHHEAAEQGSWLAQPAQQGVKSTMGLPQRSKERYELAYEKFAEWLSGRRLECLSESVFMDYFGELSKTMMPTSLWALYSMLKGTVLQRHNVNISSYNNLKSMLRTHAAGHQCKQSKVFTEQDMERFLIEAPDSEYLAAKVILIFGIYGACRTMEMITIKVNDIQTQNHVMMVTLHDTEKGTNRTFVIPDSAIALVQKYQALRPTDIKTERFFVEYRNCKCRKQAIGRHTIAAIPKRVATYLGLPNPEQYTGHCFRRSAALMFGRAGSN